MISIVLPVHNQGNHIRKVLQDYQAILEQFSIEYEFVLVANGCHDETSIICRRLGEEDSRIQVCDLTGSGWGLAVKAGIQAAKGELVCYANSARTTPKDLVLLLNYALVNKGAVIKANRKIRESFKRRLGSLLYNLECRSLFDLPTWDINGTPKIFPRKYTPLMYLSKEDDLIDLEFNIICRKENYPILEIPIISTRRFGGHSTTNLTSAYRMYWGAIVLWWQTRGKR